MAAVLPHTSLKDAEQMLDTLVGVARETGSVDEVVGNYSATEVKEHLLPWAKLGSIALR